MKHYQLRLWKNSWHTHYYDKNKNWVVNPKARTLPDKIVSFDCETYPKWHNITERWGDFEFFEKIPSQNFLNYGYGQGYEPICVGSN